MTIIEHFKFSVRGFSPKRTAYLLDVVLLAIIVSFRHQLATNYVFTNAAIFSDIFLFIVVAFLCLCSPRSADRWLPLIICGCGGIVIASFNVA
jgi:hypothetical protein